VVFFLIKRFLPASAVPRGRGGVSQHPVGFPVPTCQCFLLVPLRRKFTDDIPFVAFLHKKVLCSCVREYCT
jgi:hypothetical protein